MEIFKEGTAPKFPTYKSL